MVPAEPAATSGAKGLSSLEAVRRRLEEDQARSRSRFSQTAPPAHRVPDAVERPAELSQCAVGDLGAVIASPLGVAGGGVRAVSYLKVAEGGRASDVGAPIPLSVEVPTTTVDAAVTHPVDRGVLAARAPAGAPPLRPAPRCGPGRPGQFSATESGSSCQSKSIMDFRSNPDNFIHILRFLRDGKNFKAPEQAEARESLREEALYFGCMALVNHLDRGHGENEGAMVAAVEGSALAADLADLCTSFGTER